MYESFEETTTDLSIQISRELIRSNLVDQMKTLGRNGDMKLLEDIEQGNVVAVNCEEILAEDGEKYFVFVVGICETLGSFRAFACSWRRHKFL